MAEEAAPSVRDSINAAFEKAETTNATTTPEVPAAAPSAPAEGAPAPQPSEGDSSASVGSQEASPVPKPEAAPAPTGAAPAKPVEPPKPPEAPKPVGFKAPESWRPSVKEQWKTLTPQVQAEIIRRERQVEQVMKDSAQARQVYGEMGQLYGAFQDVFKAEATPPMQTLANLLNISRTLRSAPAPQRAQMMAQVIQQYEVDLTLLDQALAFNVQHGPARDPNAGMQKMLQQALTPVQQQLQALARERQMGQQQAQREQDAALAQEVDTFANDPKNEYFELVRNDVADILEMGAKRGQKISLAEAYQRAMLANNELAPLVTQQRLREAAATANGPAAAAAARAGFSVTGSPSVPSGPQLDPSKSVRNALENAFQQHSGRM